MIKIIGWVMWAIVTFLALSFIFGCRIYTKAGEPFHIITGVQTFFLCLISIVFLIFKLNKLFILLITPIAYFGASFIVLGGIPILSPLVLKATELFLRLILLGIKIP